MARRIEWSDEAGSQLDDIFAYILEETKSYNIASKVTLKVLKSADILKTSPEIYELDEMNIHNDGSFRAYEIYSYRISYQIMDDLIYIVRIRHTSRNVLEY